ncbi:unnamed protein product, partial [Ectocarpus fasciculatus]
GEVELTAEAEGERRLTPAAKEETPKGVGKVAAVLAAVAALGLSEASKSIRRQRKIARTGKNRRGTKRLVAVASCTLSSGLWAFARLDSRPGTTTDIAPLPRLEKKKGQQSRMVDSIGFPGEYFLVVVDVDVGGCTNFGR